MEEDHEERREIEAYLEQHHLQAFIGDAVNDVVKERPKDPLVRLADALRSCSEASRQIQKVHGRQILNGEALPALEVEVRTGQGSVYGSVSSGPFDGDTGHYEGKGLLQAASTADNILAEVLLGKDPTQQAKIDKLLAQDSSLPPNVVSAASIACCKAGAKQTLIPVYDHIGVMCNNSEGEIPATGFSVINGGRLSASSLWVQDIFVVPTGDMPTFSNRVLVASTVHRTLEVVAREAGQELLQRGPRGGFCNGAGTFEYLMGCLVTSLDNAGFLGSVEIVVDVHASKLVPAAGEDEAPSDKGENVSYDLTTFSPDKTALELTTAQALLDIYLEWLEKFPITAFIEPFAPADIATSKELLIRGHQILQAKIGTLTGQSMEASSGGASTSEAHSISRLAPDNAQGPSGEDSCLLRVIADESVLTPSQLVLVNEQRGANAIVLNIRKISSLSECIVLACRANELGWALVVSITSEEELEGEFMAELGVGLRAEQLLMGGLRSGNTMAACHRLARVEEDGVQHVGGGRE